MKTKPSNESAVSRRKFLAGTSGFLAALPAMARAQAPAESEGIVIDCHVHLVKKAFPTPAASRRTTRGTSTAATCSSRR